MKIELLSIWHEDEDLGVLVRYRIPEFEYESFININDMFDKDIEENDVNDFIYRDNWLKENEKAICDFIMKDFDDIRKCQLTHQTPLWSELDPSVTELIYNNISEMGFIDYTDCNGKCEETAKPFEEAIEKFPALSSVIEIGMTFPVCNDDVVTTYGDCACYVNWFGYQG